jgi:hypothetical protein
MDHLPVLGQVLEAYPRVPFLCTEEYDGLPFHECPDRQKWDVQRLDNGDFSEHPRHEAAAFLQTWLFFESLNEILGFPAPIDTKNFIGEHDAQLYVQTTLLYDHIAL